MILRPPVWVVTLAARFWSRVPEPPPPFPRYLAGPVACLSHLHLAELPNLTLGVAAAFLKRAGFPIPAGSLDRPLHGCLATLHSRGFILIDSDDPADERRFTLAHELAHFLRDYEEPRRRAVARIGPAVLEVFDGKRPATTAEELSGVLHGVMVGCHTHLLGRDDRGRPASPVVGEAEEAADQLAFELLAPVAAVSGSVTARNSLAARLAADFGLPLGRAAEYAGMLLPRGF